MSLRPRQSRSESRKKSYKTGVDGDGARRRREDYLVAIRKNKREDTLLKKRREPAAAADDDRVDLARKLESIPSMVQGVWSVDPIFQFEATCQFRELLSIEQSPPIDEVVNTGVIPRFVEFLGRNDAPHLQVEATQALAYVAYGTSEHTRVVIEHGAIPMFVQLLSSASDEVREKVVLALGAIAGDSPGYRDIVLSQGALMPLLDQLNEHFKLFMLRNVAWALSNFCRGKPPPHFEQVKSALPALYQLLWLQDEDVLRDVCWSLSYLSAGLNDEIQAIIETGVCQRLVQLLLHPSPTVQIPAITTVGNIANGDENQAKCIIDNQVLPSLYQLLTQPHEKNIKKEACWTVSSITAGTESQIQAVMDANIILPVVHLLQTAEFDIKKEAVWTILNTTTGGSHDQIRLLARQGCIKPLCDLLTCPDPLIVDVCLDALVNILSVGEADKESGLTNGTNPYAALVDECEGVDKILSLQIHDNYDIYVKAVTLIDGYWGEADGEEDAMQDDGSITQHGFCFVNYQSSVPDGGFDFG